MNWNGTRVLVTGADGFIGSHLVERLVAEGAVVRAFVWYNSFSRWGWLESPHVPQDVLNQVEIFPGDIRDTGRVEQAVEGMDVVFHLASLIAIPYSYVAARSYVDTNVTGALNVVEACRRHGVQRLIHTSTSEVYGTAQYVPIDEKHPLQGQSPYSASKIGADVLVDSFVRAFKLPAVTVRPFNTYGPRQSARAVIPTILSQLHSGCREIRLGALSPTRDFNFVGDTVNGFVMAAACDAAVGQVINIGSGTEISIGDLAKLLIDVSGSKATVVAHQDRMRPPDSEVERLCCNAGLALELLGWKPEVTLRQGLVTTSEWILRNLETYKPGTYNV